MGRTWTRVFVLVLILVIELAATTGARGAEALALAVKKETGYAGEFVDGVFVPKSAESRAATLAAVPASITGTSSDGRFHIVLDAQAGLAANPLALAAFQKAAAMWEARITDPITINIKADVTDLGNPFLVGQANSSAFNAIYDFGTNNPSNLRPRMIADAGAGDDIVASLPATLTALVPSGATLNAYLVLAKAANLRALGWTDADLGGPGYDGTITFNSTFSFDYDPSNGIDAGKTDFVGAAAHEIGHVLGFASIIDTLIQAVDPVTDLKPMPLDLFCFENGNANDPATAANFSTFPRNLLPGGDRILDDITTERRMSTGTTSARFPGTDGNQAGHWKDNGYTGVLIGIMDPTSVSGQVLSITEADWRALSLIGWDVTPANSTFYRNLNGEFESPVTGNFQYTPAVTATQPWTFNSQGGVATDSGQLGFGVTGTPNGQYAFLQGNGASMSQSVYLSAAGTYDLFFSVAGRETATGGPGDAYLTFTISGGLLSSGVSSDSGMPFSRLSERFTVTTPGVYTLTFTNTVASGDQTCYVDSVVINRIPTANPQTVPVTEDSSATFTITGTDPDGDAIVGASNSTGGAHGRVSTSRRSPAPIHRIGTMRDRTRSLPMCSTPTARIRTGRPTP